MATTPRHQCLIYEGSPSRLLPALAAVVQQMLNENYRCLCLNSPVMVAGLRSYLAAQDLDVAYHASKGSLVLSSDQHHLFEGCFDVDRMISSLEDALNSSIKEGYEGLWATGDMSWEFGLQRDFSKLLGSNNSSASILPSAAFVSTMRTLCHVKCCGKAY